MITPRPVWHRIFALLITAKLFCLLGAAFVFSRRTLYPAFGNPEAWGLTALEDQQLAGLLMVSSCALIYVAAAIALFARWLFTIDARCGAAQPQISARRDASCWPTGERAPSGSPSFLRRLRLAAFCLPGRASTASRQAAGHWPGFSLILEFGMRSSVRTHALGIDVPDLDDPALVERGAGHFQGGCAPCHGAPGRPSNPIVHAMLPEPPDLGATVPTWKANELFWIVKNGFKYTGMPAWVAQERDDEVWAVVAFLQRLPQIDASQYREMAGLELACSRSGPCPGARRAGGNRAGGLFALPWPGWSGRAPAAHFPGSTFKRPNTCYTSCRTMRRVRGKAASCSRSRPSWMRPTCAGLRIILRHSGQPGFRSPPRAEDSALELGRTLATAGMPDMGIPPCLSCHAEDPASRSPLYPALAGQYASYTAQQLALFKSGKRRGTPAAEIMSVIAERLTPEQIDAVSIYLAGLPPRPAGDAN